MDATIVAAWWGAVVATVLMLWEFHKWRYSGVRLRLELRKNMVPTDLLLKAVSNTKYAILTVSNYGDRSTTITHFYGMHYPSRWKALRKKEPLALIVARPAFSKPLPVLLEPGKQWSGGIEHNDELNTLITKGPVFLEIVHSGSTRPKTLRVR